VLRASSKVGVLVVVLAMLELWGLRSTVHEAEDVAFLLQLDVSDWLLAPRVTFKELRVCVRLTGNFAAIAAHDGRVFPPTSQTGSDERGRVEVGFGICCASDMLGACISLAVARCILKRLWSAVAAAECCCGLLWLRLAT
jgi:hypothetical protein